MMYSDDWGYSLTGNTLLDGVFVLGVVAILIGLLLGIDWLLHHR